MPRIEDDFRKPRKQATTRQGGDWRRRLLTWGLVAAALVLGFLIPYTIYLNHQVVERFGQLQWQLPTRVYARPLTLVPGMAMDASTLKTELDAASYRDDGAGVRPGTYQHEGKRWRIASRGFQDVSGKVGPSRIQVVVSGGKVAELRDLARDRAIRSAVLDPARIATLYGQKQEERRLVQIDDVPELLVTGLQAVEDRDFAHHHGIDLSGMARALFVTVKSGGEVVQGGSTLTQQLARSGLLGIGQEQTATRKFNEILYALLIESHYDKRNILETYMNQVYLGQRGNQEIRGMAAGAEYWFGRDLRDLSTAQIALLIGMVKGPSAYDPRRNPEAATRRRNFALEKFHETGLISDEELDRAKSAPLGITDAPGSTSANRFPAYVDLVRRQLARDYPAGALQGAGLSVMTAMSPAAQAYAEGAVGSTLKALDNAKRPPLQSGLVLTDVHTGEVLAVVGSREFTRHGFNRAVEAHRPVGSVIKPFVYLLALAQPGRWSLASWLEDSPVTVTLDTGKKWSPGNSDGRSHGTVRLIDALARSYNQATVRLGMQVGPERVADLLVRHLDVAHLVEVRLGLPGDRLPLRRRAAGRLRHDRTSGDVAAADLLFLDPGLRLNGGNGGLHGRLIGCGGNRAGQDDRGAKSENADHSKTPREIGATRFGPTWLTRAAPQLSSAGPWSQAASPAVGRKEEGDTSASPSPFECLGLRLAATLRSRSRRRRRRRRSRADVGRQDHRTVGAGPRRGRRSRRRRRRSRRRHVHRRRSRTRVQVEPCADPEVAAQRVEIDRVGVELGLRRGRRDDGGGRYRVQDVGRRRRGGLERYGHGRVG